MTIQEAIGNIEDILRNTALYDESIEYDYDWLEIAKSALEKQTPKKLIIDNRNIHYFNYKDYLCPCCKKRIITKIDGDFIAGRKSYYCDNCGQALDWSECNG